eukprot:1395272-Amorphochlora_amoeboformis.AAC.2
MLAKFVEHFRELGLAIRNAGGPHVFGRNGQHGVEYGGRFSRHLNNGKGCLANRDTSAEFGGSILTPPGELSERQKIA